MPRKPGIAVPALALMLLPVAAGCGQTPAPAPSAVPEAPAAAPASSEPLEVELYEPKMKLLDPETVMMEVKYKCVKGTPGPTSHYRLIVRFSNSSSEPGVMPMFGPAVRKEGGTFKDGFTLLKPGPQEYEISLTQGEVNFGPFHSISNVVKGEIGK